MCMYTDVHVKLEVCMVLPVYCFRKQIFFQTGFSVCKQNEITFW